jgi:hypothetical protein
MNKNETKKLVQKLVKKKSPAIVPINKMVRWLNNIYNNIDWPAKIMNRQLLAMNPKFG